MHQILQRSLEIGSGLVIAQPGPPGANDFLRGNIGQDIWGIVKAIIILVVGWIIATVVRSLIEKILKQTDIDNRIAAWVMGSSDEERLVPVEKWGANIAFWIVFLFAIVAALNSLRLEAVSVPLNNLLNQITTFIPQVAGAALLLGLAWLLATLAKIVVTRTLQTVRLDERVGQQLSDSTVTTNQFALSNTIGNAIYWLIFLIFIPAVLSTLRLEGTLGPVQAMVNDILAVLPKILSAVLIAAVGWFIAQIVRNIVTNLLMATGINRIGAKFGLSQAPEGRSLAWIIGTIVYVFILIPTGIEALNKLNIESISGPGTQMLQQVLNKIPQIFSAVVVLILAYIIAKYVGDFVTDILREVGFDNVFQWLGIATPSPELKVKIPTDTTSETTTTTKVQGTTVVSGLEGERIPRTIPKRSPSELVGIIVVVGIMLVAALTAVDILEIQALRTVVGVILILAGRVLLALVILAIGLYLANFAFSFITSSGTNQSRTLAQSARIAIIILSTTMALQQLGIAPNIINLAFGLLLGGVAVAIALAFGLGGRDIAAQQIREWRDSFKNQ
ncbi:mechanosensitive ion channel [Gloeocapsa sp. PCC 73106]|uniref:mechanosensitive ion channel n=1 Tax=Gloeocapsa sp. PCC 73106 TaxID=102232 RepID=UPI0002AC52FD|nr:mechanosensitive ion channel [Gloeocapsa sp. PCC 73106]ELR97800.1 hypothetical protein GLO73106DRAFT_00016170 [Gloeocapsa sp. PCC 73106]